MNISENITNILNIAPAKISEYAEKENKFYSDMIIHHEEHKRLYAKKYLELRATRSISVKDVEMALESDDEIKAVKDKEILSEIEYRGWKAKKDKASNTFQSAIQLGLNFRAEVRASYDTIKEN